MPLKPVPRGLVTPLPLPPCPPPRPRPQPLPLPRPEEVFLMSSVKALTVVSPAVMLLLLILNQLKVVWCSPSLCPVVGYYMYLVECNPRYCSHRSLFSLHVGPAVTGLQTLFFMRTLYPAAAWPMSSSRSLSPHVAFPALFA